MTDLLRQLHQMVWGPWTLAIFLGVGVFYSLKGGLFQIRGFSYWWSHTVGSLFGGNVGDDGNGGDGPNTGDGRNAESSRHTGQARSAKEHGISQVQSVCTALAATVGTGNIAGVATALAAGGPGALLWMWISAGIGMATAYGETALGLMSRKKDRKGRYISGPFIYMERLLGARWMGRLYAVLCLLCSLGMGSMVQSNSAVSTISYSWDIPANITGTALTFLVMLVILGGIGRIGWVAEKLVPIASGIYIFFSMAVILSCWRQLPGAVWNIVSCGLTPRAAAGGAAGYGMSQAVRYGLARGVFSNEAGLGTLAVLHGAARDTSPAQQGMWAMFEVFFDTVVLCTMTALVILCMTDSMKLEVGADGAALAAWCFEQKLGNGGEMLISGSMVVFAFATMIAWFYLGRQAVSYAVGGLGLSGKMEEGLTGLVYPALFLGAVFAGSFWRLETVWTLSDLWNGLMAFPNLTALIFLQAQVIYPDWKGWKKRRGGA